MACSHRPQRGPSAARSALPNARLAALACACALVATGAARAAESAAGYVRAPNGQRVFLAGANIAWVSYGRDLPAPNVNAFNDRFRQIRDAGGNSCRWWLFESGNSGLSWDGNGKCTGLAGGTLQGLKSVLDAARNNGILLDLCLFSFQMGNNASARKALSDTAYTRAFIDNALMPMVRGLKGHPSLLTWEIFNEPEGMVPDFGSWGGWDNKNTDMAQVERFINKCSGAIHREDPKALVSSGAWSPLSALDMDKPGFNAGFPIANHYKDSVLLKAGGDPLGVLDYYQIHFYAVHPAQVSPFTHSAAAFKFDKPAVVAEFYPDAQNGVAGDQLMNRLLDSGYAGGWAWSMTDRPWSAMAAPIQAVSKRLQGEDRYDPKATVGILRAMAAPGTGRTRVTYLRSYPIRAFAGLPGMRDGLGRAAALAGPFGTASGSFYALPERGGAGPALRDR